MLKYSSLSKSETVRDNIWCHVGTFLFLTANSYLYVVKYHHFKHANFNLLISNTVWAHFGVRNAEACMHPDDTRIDVPAFQCASFLRASSLSANLQSAIPQLELVPKPTLRRSAIKKAKLQAISSCPLQPRPLGSLLVFTAAFPQWLECITRPPVIIRATPPVSVFLQKS